MSAKYAENQVLSGGVSAILRSGLILENIRRMVLLSVWVTGTIYMNSDEKHSSNVLENPTRLQNSTDHQKELDFPHTLCFQNLLSTSWLDCFLLFFFFTEMFLQ